MSEPVGTNSGGSRVAGEVATLARQVLAAAQQLYDQQPDWATFFRRVLGDRGVIRRAFPDIEDLELFRATPAYRRIQEMLADLRRKAEQTARDRRSPHRVYEPTHMITVRVPSSVHKALLTEAGELGTSLNQLCISKLLQLVDAGFIPGHRRDETEDPASTMNPDDEDWLQSIVI